MVGFRERGKHGRIVIRQIYASQQLQLEDEILFVVEQGSTMYSDKARTYNMLERWYEHYTVNHKKDENVRDKVTTNSMESVWSVVKRAHEGIYLRLSLKHGHRYLNEVAYRCTKWHLDKPFMLRIRGLSQRPHIR